MRIRTKISTGIGFLILLYAVATALFISTLQRSYRTTLEEHASLFSSQVEARVEDRILHIRDELALLARTGELTEAFGPNRSPDTVREVEQWLEESFLDYFTLQYGTRLISAVEGYGDGGELILSTEGGAADRDGGSVVDTAWWRRTMENGFALEEVLLEERERVLLRVAVRVAGPRGAPEGILSGLVEFPPLVRSAEIQVRPFESTVLTVVSRRGSVLYRSTPFVLFEDLSDEAFFEGMTGESGVITAGNRGRRRLYAYDTLGLDLPGFTEPWYFVISYSLEEAFSGVERARSQLIAFLLLLLALAVAITFWVYRGIRRPLDELLHAVERVGSRDLGYRPSAPGSDEVSIVVRQFDLMREKLQYFYNEMARQTETEREERQKAEAIAGTDELTRLFNRRAFFEFLSRRIEEAEAAGRDALAVIYFDLNGFKPINDSHGHALGDRVLQTVGRRLLNATREGDFAARVGGDEFAVVLTSVSDISSAEQAAARLVSAVAGQIHLEGKDLTVGLSAGIALYPDHGRAAEPLVERADRAMYAAKASLGPDRTASESAVRAYSPEDES